MNVAFSRNPWTTARKRGVSPFNVRHWAAPGGDAATQTHKSKSACWDLQKEELSTVKHKRHSHLKRSSPEYFCYLLPQPRAGGSILAHQLWTESPAAALVCRVQPCHLQRSISSEPLTLCMTVWMSSEGFKQNSLPSLMALKISSGSLLGFKSLNNYENKNSHNEKDTCGVENIYCILMHAWLISTLDWVLWVFYTESDFVQLYTEWLHLHPGHPPTDKGHFLFLSSSVNPKRSVQKGQL